MSIPLRPSDSPSFSSYRSPLAAGPSAARQKKTTTARPSFEWNPRSTNGLSIEWRQDGTIVLPPGTEYTPRDISSLVRRFSLAELLPLLASLIGQGRLELVERLIGRIQVSHARSWSSHEDVSLANALLRAYLERGRLEEAIRWREFIFARKSVRPDPLTYSILFRFLLTRLDWEEGEGGKAVVLEEIGQLCDEMVSKDRLSVKQLLTRVEYLSAEEGRQLMQVSGHGGDGAGLIPCRSWGLA